MTAKASKKTSIRQDAGRSLPGPLHGVYPQKQNGLFMQRIKILGGRISWSQWRKIAQLAAAHSSGFPLHLTTRQDIELHNITANSIPDVQQHLAKVGLTTFAAGGDSLRNITVCTGCQTNTDAADVFPIARILCQHLLTEPCILNLPRKFKISFSGCPAACAKPWVNDLAFVCQPNGLCTVIGAGSLGARPALGIQLYNDLPAEHIVPLALAALRFFEQCGNRKNRRQARFRHIREKLGDQAFRLELNGRFNQLKACKSWPKVATKPIDRNLGRPCQLQLPNGNISPKDAVQLADVAEPAQAELRINLQHGLELYGTQPVQLPAHLRALEAYPMIVACPGAATCPKALTNCWVTADSIRRALSSNHQVRISISGCPNNCAHSAVADIGLVGLLRKQNGKPTEHYQLLTGGHNGKDNKLAERADAIPACDIPTTIRQLLDRSPLAGQD